MFPAYQKHILSNKLRLVTVPVPGTESATVFVAVRAGSRLENAKNNGLSHFLEHMAFKGTKKRPNTFDISSLIDGVGGEINAFTSKEYTDFYIKVAKNHLELALDILSDIFTNSLFKPEEINRERGVIIEEINMREDIPMSRVGEIYENLLYQPTPLGQDIIGTKKNILSIKRQDFLDYMSLWYQPSNMVIAIAGNIDNKQALELTQIYFADFGQNSSSLPDIPKFNFSQNQAQVRVYRKPTQQAHFCLGVPAFKRNDPRRYALSVLSVILGGNMSSRLFIEVRERRGLAYYIRSSKQAFFETGHFVTRAGTDLNKIEQALKVILAEYARIATDPVPPDELDRAKDYIKGSLILELEDSYQAAAVFADSWALEGRIRTPDMIFQGIDSVTQEDVLAVAKTIFTPSQLNLAVIGPYGESEKQSFTKLLTF